MNPVSFFHHSNPKTRGAQRLHQEQAQHPVLFDSVLPHTVSELNLLPMAISYLFSPFTQVLPELNRPQSPPTAVSPHLSMNTKILYMVLILDRLSF